MDFLNAQLQRYLIDERPPTNFFDGPQDATVVRVSGDHVWFVIPDFDADAAFGPATVTVPPAVGDQIVVVFVGAGVDRPRIVSLPALTAADVAFTPSGDLTALDVQAAIEQLDVPITKATIDALNVDAGTLDGHDSTFFYSTANPPPVSGAMINQTIRGTIATSGPIGSATATIVTVNTAKTQLRALGINSSSSSSTIPACRVELTNSTTVTALWNVSNSAASSVGYELTEWT